MSRFKAPSRRERLGSYEIAGPIGAGGMGEVYRAHVLFGGAVKVMIVLVGQIGGQRIAVNRI